VSGQGAATPRGQQQKLEAGGEPGTTCVIPVLPAGGYRAAAEERLDTGIHIMTKSVRGVCHCSAGRLSRHGVACS
jgi:hypothetical protein